MSAFAATEFRKPADEQAFERACEVLLRCILNDPNAKRYGKRGNRQFGVDIVGCRNGDPQQLVGVQCKRVDSLTESKIRAEVTQALDFRPSLTEYFIWTTVADNAKYDSLALELTQQHSKDKPLRISVWGWQTLCQRIAEHSAAVEAFDETHSSSSKHLQQQIENLSAQVTEISDVSRTMSASIGIVQSSVTQVHAVVVKDESVEPAPTDPIEIAFETRIDSYRDLLNAVKPKTAKTLLEELLKELGPNVSGRIRFRTLANIGHCHLMLGDHDKAADYFIEGFEAAPSEPKAIANLILGKHLKGLDREAYDIGLAQLQLPTPNVYAAIYFLAVARRLEGIPDPISAIPESLRENPDVELACIDFTRSKNQTPEWWESSYRAFVKFPTSDMIRQYYAESVVDRASKDKEFASTGRFSEEDRNKLVEATKVLRSRFDKIRNSEAPHRDDGMAAASNLLAALYLLGDTATALEIAHQAFVVAPNDQVLGVRVAIAAVEGGDSDLAERVLRNLQPSTDSTMVRFQYFSQKGDWEQLATLADEKFKQFIPSSEEKPIRTMSALAKLMLDRASVKKESFDLIFEIAGDDIRSNIILADLSMFMGFPDISERAYLFATSEVSKGSHRASRYMVALHAARKKDWTNVIALLDHHLDSNTDSSELRELAAAFVNETPTRRRALEFFSQLPDKIKNTFLYLQAYGLLQSKRGELSKAKDLLEKSIALKPKHLGVRLALYAVLLRDNPGGSRALIEADLASLEIQNMRGSPEEKMTLAHQLLEVGRKIEAIDFAYNTLRAFPNDEKVSLGYLGLLLSPNANGVLTPATTVDEDTWIHFKENSGRELTGLIVMGDGDAIQKHVSVNHPLVVAARGLSVGTEFTHKSGLGDEENWKVVEVKNKYLAALHELAEVFELRFPNSDGFFQIKHEPGDLTPLLEKVKKYAERVSLVADQYIKDKYPLAVIAGRMRRSTISLAELVRSEGAEIIACFGNPHEREEATSKVAEWRGKTAVLDLYTAWVAARIGALEIIKGVFPRVVVAPSVIDALTEMLGEDDDEPRMSIGYRDGQYSRQEVSVEQIKEHKKLISQAREDVLKHCEVVAIDAPNERDLLTNTLIEASGKSSLDATFLAAEVQGLLVSDDLYFRQFATVLKISQSVWLQPILSYARSLKICDHASYAKCLVGLSGFRHTHLSVDARTLLDVLSADKTPHLFEFASVSFYIGNKQADVPSHLGVASEFLRVLWQLDFDDLKRQAATGLILHQLLRHQKNWADLLASIYTIRTSTELKKYLGRWVMGHFVGHLFRKSS